MGGCDKGIYREPTNLWPGSPLSSAKDANKSSATYIYCTISTKSLYEMLGRRGGVSEYEDDQRMTRENSSLPRVSI